MMDMRREVEQMVSEQLKQMMGRMNLVSREEFDVVKAMAEKARAENETLKARLDALENAPATTPKTAKKPASSTSKKKSTK